MALTTATFIFNVFSPLACAGGQGAGGAEASRKEEIKDQINESHWKESSIHTLSQEVFYLP